MISNTNFFFFKMNTEAIKEIALSIGDTTITGRDCFVTSMSISSTPAFDNVASRSGHFIPVPIHQEYTISFELICNDLSYVDRLLNSKDLLRIRDKKTESCTIEELMFAIREKIKRDE